MRRCVPELFGGITLVGGERGLKAILFEAVDNSRDEAAVLLEAEKQLREYAAGTRFVFDLELEPEGTPFQLEVWNALKAIRYAETCTYRDIALAVKRSTGFRAVGNANGRNPLPIVIPCHRVIGSDGSLTGYGGGMPLKQTLLNLEAKYAYRSRKTTA